MFMLWFIGSPFIIRCSIDLGLGFDVFVSFRFALSLFLDVRVSQTNVEMFFFFFSLLLTVTFIITLYEKTIQLHFNSLMNSLRYL